MSLSVTGECLVNLPRTIKSRKDGTIYNFNTAIIFDSASNSAPVNVNTFELALSKGKFYTIPVNTSIYEDNVQLNSMKNSPPQEYSPLSDKLVKS